MYLYESSEEVLSIFQQKLMFLCEIKDKNYKYRPLHRNIFAYNCSGFCWLKKTKLPNNNIDSYLLNEQHFTKANECSLNKSGFKFFTFSLDFSYFLWCAVPEYL